MSVRRRPGGIRGGNAPELAHNELPVTPLPRPARANAVRYVAGQAKDAADLALLLDALGLTAEEAR